MLKYNFKESFNQLTSALRQFMHKWSIEEGKQ